MVDPTNSLSFDKNFSDAIITLNSSHSSSTHNVLLECSNQDWLSKNFKIKDTGSQLMWEKLFNFYYEKSAPLENFVDSTSVWVSSYTQTPIPKQEMDEWLNLICDKISSYTNKKSAVLEVGCGNGLILNRILPEIESYVGIDYSGVTVERLAKHIQEFGQEKKAKVFKASALELSNLPSKKYDLIIINSVAQYFSSLDYFLRFVASLESFLNKDSVIIFGDIRSLPHRDLFYQKVFHGRTKGNTAKVDDIAKLRLGERETLYHPSVFKLLPGFFSFIDTVEIDVKRGIFSNEMNEFRYDVILHNKSTHKAPPTPSTILDWNSTKLKQLTEINSLQGTCVQNVPNPRLSNYDRTLLGPGQNLILKNLTSYFNPHSENPTWFEWDVSHGLDKLQVTFGKYQTSPVSLPSCFDDLCNKIADTYLTGEKADAISSQIRKSLGLSESATKISLFHATETLIHFCRYLNLQLVSFSGLEQR